MAYNHKVVKIPLPDATPGIYWVKNPDNPEENGPYIVSNGKVERMYPKDNVYNIKGLF